MLKEMKLYSPKSSTTYSGKVKSVDFGTQLSGSKSPKAMLTFNSKASNEKLMTSPIDRFDGSLESTFYKTNRDKMTEGREDILLENLKYFVANSNSVKRIEDEPLSNSKVVFSSKDYLSEKNTLLDSIYHEDSFKNIQKRKQRTYSQTSSNFFNFNREKILDNNVRKMENVVTELKSNVFDRINREVTEKSKFKDEMENNVEILSTRLKVSQHRLGNFKHSNTNTQHDTTKLEYYSERILRENSHMDMELTMLKKRIEEMRNEIFEKDRESKQLKYQIYRDESEVAFLQEENRRVGKQVVDLHSEKKNMMTAIVLMKKQNDLLKSKVIKEDGKSKEFIAEVSALLSRGKVIY